MKFISSRLSEAKHAQVYSSLVTVQPFVGELTYVIHPLFLGLYSHFCRELLIR